MHTPRTAALEQCLTNWHRGLAAIASVLERPVTSHVMRMDIVAGCICACQIWLHFQTRDDRGAGLRTNSRNNGIIWWECATPTRFILTAWDRLAKRPALARYRSRLRTETAFKCDRSHYSVSARLNCPLGPNSRSSVPSEILPARSAICLLYCGTY